VIWARNSPKWRYDDAVVTWTAAAFDNPDYVEVVLHSYRHRLGLAPGAPEYADLERRLAGLPEITVPDGHLGRDGGRQLRRPPTARPTPAGSSAARAPPGAGRRSQPPAGGAEAFADAVLEVARLGVRSRTG
jgi:hypothetical protein